MRREWNLYLGALLRILRPRVSKTPNISLRATICKRCMIALRTLGDRVLNDSVLIRGLGFCKTLGASLEATAVFVLRWF